MSTISQKLASGSALRVANVGANTLISLLILPFIIRMLGDRMYGVWTLVATFIGYYGVLELGLNTAVTRYLSRSLATQDHEESNRVFNSALRIYLGLAIVVLLVAVTTAALAPFFAKNRQDASLFFDVILILGVSLALQFPTRVFIGALEAHLRFDQTAGFDLLTLALRTGLIIAILLAGYKIVGLAWVTLLSGIPSMALSIRCTFKELPFLRFDSRYWGTRTAKTLFSYGSYSLIAGLANILRFQVDNIVVASFIGLEAVTHYRIAGALVQYFFVFMSSIMGVLPSVFSRQEGAQDHEAIRKTFLFATKIAICITCFIAFGMIAWGASFIQRWMGSKYMDAYPVLVVLVSAYTLNLWQGPAASLLYGISKHKFIAILNTVEGISNLALSLWLVRIYGMMGVALGTLIPTVVTRLFINPAYACRVAGIGYSQYARRMGKTLGVVAASLIAPLVLSIKLAKPNYPSLFVAGSLSLLAYAIALWMFEFSPEEAELIRRAMPNREASPPAD
jgi:O-antigen/teichoic acid export membrane protein